MGSIGDNGGANVHGELCASSDSKRQRLDLQEFRPNSELSPILGGTSKLRKIEPQSPLNKTTENSSITSQICPNAVFTHTDTCEENNLIKGGRLLYKDCKRRLIFHPETVKELHLFHCSKSQNMDLDKFLPLIAKLVQDSDETVNDLSIELKNILFYRYYQEEEKDQEILTTIEKTILKVAERVNYGVRDDFMDNLKSGLSLWRWEVKNTDFLPSDIIKELSETRATREKICIEIETLLNNMTMNERDKLQSGKRKKKTLHAIPISPISSDCNKQEIKEEITTKSSKESTPSNKKVAHTPDVNSLIKKSLKGLFDFHFTKFKKEEKLEARVLDADDPIVKFRCFFPIFFLKSSMSLAPNNRFLHPLSDVYEEQLFDDYFPVSIENIIDHVPSERILPLKKDRNVQNTSFDEDVTIYSPNIPVNIAKSRFKLLCYYEDVRPAYYGTWSKKSKKISGRRPFAKDNQLLDYDYDSEAEWEEDEEGEECISDEEGEEDEGSDDDEEEDDWVVPAGYLSADEGIEEGDEDAEEERELSIKSVLNSKRPRIIERLIPVVIGPCFDKDVCNLPIELQSLSVNYFIVDDWIDPMKENCVDDGTEVDKKVSTKRNFPEEYLSQLIQVVNGSTQGIQKLVEKLKQNLTNVSKSQIEAKIRDIAVKEKRASDQKVQWYVKENVIKDLPCNIQESMQETLEKQSPKKSTAPLEQYFGFSNIPPQL